MDAAIAFLILVASLLIARIALAQIPPENWFALNRITPGRDLALFGVSGIAVRVGLLATDRWNGHAAIWLLPVEFACTVLGVVAYSIWRIERGHLTRHGAPSA